MTSWPSSLEADSFEAFTGKPPFHDIAPTPAGVGVLMGKRPMRPLHPELTDGLWKMTIRCWNQDPQLRPGISEVVLCVRHAIEHGDEYTNASDDQASENAIPESIHEESSMIRAFCFIVLRFFD